MSEPPEPTRTMGPALEVAMHRGPRLCHGCPAPACASSPRQPGGGSSPKSVQCRPFHTPGSGKNKVRVMAPLQGPPPLQELSGAGQGEQRVDGVSTYSSSFSGWRGGGGGGPRGSQAEAQSPCGQLQSSGDRMSNALKFIWKERGYAMGFAEN